MNAVVVLSGGLDSAVALAEVKAAGLTPLAVTFDYGQSHAREVLAARALAEHYGVDWRVQHVPVFTGSALTGDRALPLAGYDEATMSDTVVHGRNLVFASLAVALAGEGGSVTLGVHGGDHHIYPDCRPEFWRGLERVVAQAYAVALRAPFIDWTKTQIVRRGAVLGVPFHLTYSCYVGGQEHCGKCGTCRERREAFSEAQVTDPTRYAA